MANTTADKLDYLNGTKNTLKTNLTGKGIEVAEETTFRQMSEMVSQIKEQKTAQLNISFDNVSSNCKFSYIDSEGQFQSVVTKNNSNIYVSVPSIFYINRPSESVVSSTSGQAAVKLTGSVADLIYVYGDSSISLTQF